MFHRCRPHPFASLLNLMREVVIDREADVPVITDEAHVPLMESHTVHKPFVAASRSLPEWTPRAIILGSLLGIIFGASSVYLALRVGLTVSASIPIAVMSISIFRASGRLARSAADDTSPARVDRQGARALALPGGDGMRRSPRRRRKGGHGCQTGLRRIRRRGAL